MGEPGSREKRTHFISNQGIENRLRIHRRMFKKVLLVREMIQKRGLYDAETQNFTKRKPGMRTREIQHYDQQSSTVRPHELEWI